MTGEPRKAQFVIELEPTDRGIRLENAKTDSIVEATPEVLEKIGKAIEANCEAFINQISSIQKKPKEIGIEFGVDAAGEAGIPLVTKGSIGANFKVTFKWEFK